MLVDRIDDVLNQNRSSIYEQESIDEGRSMVENLMSPSNLKAPEEDDIIKTTRELLAQLKNDQEVADSAAATEEEKTGDHKAQLAKLGTLIDKADQFR